MIRKTMEKQGIPNYYIFTNVDSPQIKNAFRAKMLFRNTRN